MPKVIPLYRWSKPDAKNTSEFDEWVASYRENCDCARKIEKTIAEYYKNNSLNSKGAKEIIKRFGFDRVNWVLANTIQSDAHDGRYSPSNKQWARGFYIPSDEKRLRNNFMVTAHPGLVDMFTNQVRKEWDKLGLYSLEHCYSENEEMLDYTGKVVVIDPSVLKDEFKTPDDQLFYASSGNGCRPDSLGRKVFGQFLKDGESCYHLRGEILGVMRLELLPEWAQKKYNELTSPKNDGGMGEQK